MKTNQCITDFLHNYLPMFEVRVIHPVGEALTTNTNTFKHTVTGELMHHQSRVHHT